MTEDTDKKIANRIRCREFYQKAKLNPDWIAKKRAKVSAYYNAKRNSEAFLEKKRARSRAAYLKQKQSPENIQKMREAWRKKAAALYAKRKLNREWLDKKNAYVRNQYKNNAEKIAKQRAAIKNKNPEKHNETLRIRYKNRMMTDVAFVMVKRLRRRTREALRGKLKHETTLNLLGCSRQEFIEHLQSKFKDGMSWDNIGKWHIDHVIPCAKFNLSLPEEQKKCFHYTNTQPLWATDNLKKGDKLISDLTPICRDVQLVNR